VSLSFAYIGEALKGRSVWQVLNYFAAYRQEHQEEYTARLHAYSWRLWQQGFLKALKKALDKALMCLVDLPTSTYPFD